MLEHKAQNSLVQVHVGTCVNASHNHVGDLTD